MALCGLFAVVSAMLKSGWLRFAIAFVYECVHGQCVHIVCRAGQTEED